jgi:hypothetical protein
VAGEVDALTTGRLVSLRPVDAGDLPALHRLVNEPEVSVRFRFQGRAVGPEEFERTLWPGIVTQHVAVSRVDGLPVAWLLLYDGNFRDGTAKLALVAWPAARRTPALLEAVVLFVILAFQLWPWRKLYAEVPAYNLSQLGSLLGTFCETEGVLRDHQFHLGTYHDVHLLSLSREAIDRARPRVGRLLALVPGGMVLG